jgi:IMP dehydrogenase
LVIPQGYDFDDVLVRPIPSYVNSRSEVDISIRLPNMYLAFPLIASPMFGIVDAKFASLLSDYGGLAILHRFYDTNMEMFKEAKSLVGKNFGVSVGLNDKNYKQLLHFNPKILCIDIANAYTKSVLDFCNEVKSYIINNQYNTLLMTGNVCTRIGVENLRDNGVDIVRFGIGGGSVCSTRNVTSIAIPQITALQEIYNIEGILICADGGIRNSGDFVKAIVAGGDFAMSGGLFAQTYESPSKDNIFGMASRTLNEMKFTQIKSIEGIEKAIEKKHSLSQFMNEFSWGVRSAGTYLNARDLSEIRKNGEFIRAGTGSIKNL